MKLIAQKKPLCKQCGKDITPENKLLKCNECGLNFCEECEKQIQKEETFSDGFETHKLITEYTLCEKCYVIFINKQKELFTMHRRFLQLRETLPSEPEVWISTAEQFMVSGIHDLARLCFNEAINIDDENINKIVKTWEEAGVKLLHESRYQDAILCFDDALSLDSKSENGWLNKGRAFDYLNRLTDALVSFDKVLQLNNNNYEALSCKGLLLGKMKNQKGAEKCFDKAIKINSDDEIVWICKSQYHKILEEYTQLIDCVNHALEINPNNTSSWFSKWEGLMILNDFPEALKCCDEIIKLQPKSSIGWKCKGDTLIKLEDLDQAVETFNRALNLDPEGVEIDISDTIKKKREAMEKLGKPTQFPDWMAEGSYIIYDYASKGDNASQAIVEINFETPSDESVVLIEKTPKGETKKINLNLTTGEDQEEYIIQKYWIGFPLALGYQLKDLDGKVFSVNEQEELETPFGTINCWRLDHSEVKGKAKININSWFDSESGLLIKRIFDRQRKDKKSMHLEMKIQDSNISIYKRVTSPTEIAEKTTAKGQIGLLDQDQPVIPIEEEKVLTEPEQIKEPVKSAKVKLKLKESVISEDERGAFELEKQRYEELKNRFEDEVSHLEEEKTTLEKTQAALITEKEAFEKQLTTFKSEKSEFEIDKETLRDERGAFEEEQKQRLDETEKSKLKREEKHHEEALARKELKSEQKKIERNRQRLIDWKSRLKEEKNQLEEEKKQISEDKNQNIEMNKQLEQERAIIEEEKQNFESEKVELENAKGNIEIERQEFLGAKESLETVQNEFEQMKSNLKKDFKKLEAEKDQLEQMKSNLEKDFNKLEAEKDQFEQIKLNREKDFDKLEAEKDQFEQIKLNQEKDFDKLEADRNQFEEEKKAIEAERQKFEEEKANFKKQKRLDGKDRIEPKPKKPEEIEKEKIRELEPSEIKELETLPDAIDVEDLKLAPEEAEDEAKDKKMRKKKKLKKGEGSPELESGKGSIEVFSVSQILSEDEQNKLHDQVNKLEELSNEENDEIINIVQKYFNSYRQLLKVLNESGADVSKIRKLFGKSRAKLKENDYLGAVALYSEINNEMKNYENNLIGYEIDLTTKEVESVSDKYPTASAIGALSKARKELDKDNIEDAKSLISESQKLISDMEEQYLKAQEIIDNVEQKIKSFQNSGLNISNAMEILSEMQEAFKANKYLELPNLKKKCLLEIEKSRTKYSEVLVKIGVTQKKLSEKHKQGVNIVPSVNAIKDAKKFLIAGDYDQAIELTDKSIDLVDEQYVTEESSDTTTALEEKEGETPGTMIDIAWGDSYLLMDTTAVVAFTIQRLLSEQNVSSLTVSYLSAQELSDKHTFKPDIAIWLNESDDKDAVMPSDLSKLTKKITKFIKGTEMSIILIDGLEIIIQYNDLDHVKDFLEGLKKTIDKKQSIMILIMNPNEISEEEAEALKDICKDLVNVDMKSIFKLL